MAKLQFVAKTPNGCNAVVRVEDSGNISINGAYSGYLLSNSGNIVSSSGSIAAKGVGVKEFLIHRGLLRAYGQLNASLVLAFFTFLRYFYQKIIKNFGKIYFLLIKCFAFYGMTGVKGYFPGFWSQVGDDKDNKIKNLS